MDRRSSLIGVLLVLGTVTPCPIPKLVEPTADQLRATYVALDPDGDSESQVEIDGFAILGDAQVPSLGRIRVVDLRFSWNTSSNDAARHGAHRVLIFKNGRYLGSHRVDYESTEVTLVGDRLFAASERGEHAEVSIGTNEKSSDREFLVDRFDANDRP
jgi:hypothetical protein